MTTHEKEKTEIRELTVAEIDSVDGGLFWGWAVGAIVGVAAAGAVALGMAYGSATYN